MSNKHQFINPTTCLSFAPDEHATQEMTLPMTAIEQAMVVRASRPHVPTMQQISYRDASHLLQLVIAHCPAHVAIEAVAWAPQVASVGMTMVMRDYGLTFIYNN